MQGIVVVAAGVIMVLSSAAHSMLGWPAMSFELEKAGVREDLAAPLAVGWFFGSMSMLAFGIITVIFGRRLKRGDRSGAPAIAVIAAAYVLFGTFAIVIRQFDPHFLLFICTGLLAGVPLIEPRRQ